jgi:probable HAF family extracellular repeat protein
MRRTFILLVLLFGFAATATGGVGPSTGGTHTFPQLYEIIDLGTFGSPGSETGSNATGLNELGHVVGIAEDDDGANHAFIYRDGELIDLGWYGDSHYSNGKGINDHDQVVGQASAPQPGGSGYIGIPFLWTEEGGMVDLTDASGAIGWSWGINNSMQCALTIVHAYFWDPSEGLRKIEFDDSPAGNWGSEAWEINDSGVVCGSSRRADFFLHAFRYFSDTDTIVDLHDAEIYRHTLGYGINEHGDVAGYGQRYDNYNFPILWTIEGKEIQFPEGDIRPDLLTGQAEHVNNRGDVVGHDVSYEYGMTNEAWVAFNAKKGPVNKQALESLISPADQAEWEITAAFEINDNRQIAGIGLHNGLSRAFLMTPVSTTVSADLTCQPSSGTVPFVTAFGVTLDSHDHTRPATVAAARIDVVLAGGGSFANWKAGTRNLGPGETFVTGWNQVIPALGSLIGANVFTLAVEDITPAPYNQPPYPFSGDTVTDSCTVTAVAP